MEALGIAFDNIIIGALALPWALFAADLFFLKNQEDENRVRVAWAFVTKNVDPRVAGVVLFAVTYLVGSAISRTAEDFFNDAELIGPWLTEDYIRTTEQHAPADAASRPQDRGFLKASFCHVRLNIEVEKRK